MRNGQEPIYNNTTMKTLLRTLLVAVCCMTASKATAQYFENNGIYYYHSKDGGKYAEVKHTGRSGKMYSGDIVIPDSVEYEGNIYVVKYIDYDAFLGCKNLKSVILPNSISLINARAFKGCTGLAYVYIPPKAKIGEDAFNECPNLHFYQHPNEAKVNVTMTVIDTLMAESIFQEMKPALMEAYQKGTDKKERCHELCSMVGKKVKGESDLMLIRQASNCTLNSIRNIRMHLSPLYEEFVIEVKRDVVKGKITKPLQECLSFYLKFLTDSLKKEQVKIERGWSGMSKSELPYKQISIPMPNYFYRGYRYLNNDDLDSMDIYMQQKGWEFLNTKNRKYRSESYPEEGEYLVYDASPEYRVTYSGNNIKEVYNKDGKLIYVPYLTREINAAELKDVHRLVYFKDYINNKYDIQSEPKQTQEYLKLILCRDNDQALKYSDNIGKRYIEQLEKDHAEEFGYVYMIERLSNVSFQIVYLNKQTLEPSYCAVITYKTGEKPYTSTFSTKLVDIPDNIPPVIKE